VFETIRGNAEFCRVRDRAMSQRRRWIFVKAAFVMV
jgi:hypothetical protein